MNVYTIQKEIQANGAKRFYAFIPIYGGTWGVEDPAH
jgi:hypothetical protein